MIALVLAVGLSVWACGGDEEDDEDKDGDDDDSSTPLDQAGNDYRDALPDVASLTLSMPESEGSKGLGELATLYDATVDFTRDVNGHFLLYLGHIDEITSYEPTSQEGDTLTWGPWTDPYTPPTTAEMLFEMTLVADSTYEYFLKWRIKDSGEDWTNIWVGYTEHNTSTARRGVGYFNVYATEAKAIDPTINESGTIFVDYDTVNDGRRIDIEYEDFYSEEWEGGEGPSEAIDATYNYYSHADGIGEFLFDWWDDAQRELPGEEYHNMEHYWFSTRWQAAGAGRSDVIITEGDLEDIGIDYYGSPIESVNVSECWGNDFMRAYYVTTVYFENGPGAPEVEGEGSACVFDEQFPETK